MKYLYLRDGGRRSFYVFSLVILLVSVNQNAGSLMPASQESHWTTPQTIPGYHPETWPPILVADQNRTVHAFSYQWIKNDGVEPIRAIVYNQWTVENGWTNPVDILMSPVKEAQLTDVYLDGNEVFHVVFLGGDNTGANVYYSKAPAAIADDARAWSSPVTIGENAGEAPEGDIVEDSQGILHIIYYGRQPENGLYVVSSRDGGENWSDPAPIFFAQPDEPNIRHLQFIKDRSGGLHAIWGVYSIQAQGRGVYYAKSMDGEEWSQPVLMADAQEGLGTAVPTIIEYNDVLFAFYITQVPLNKIIIRRSTDGGETWDDPAIIFQRHQGANGTLSLLIDSGENLHLFFGQRIGGSPDIHGMWHSIYKNGRWQEPQAVVKGPLVEDDIGNNGFDPFEARGVVVQGNVILLTWVTDRASKENGVWYSYKVLDTQEIPANPIPLTVPQEKKDSNVVISNTSTPTVLPVSSPVGTANSNIFPDKNNRELNVSDILAISMIPVLACILIIIVLKKRGKKS